MNKLEPDPRVTQGAGFFNAVIEWMRRAALVVNALVDGLATKADIDSPALTGTPTAPTPGNSDNSTRIATTAWVRNALGTIFTALGFAASFSTTGYLKFPSILGGFIFQWGMVSGTTNGSGIITCTFPMTFPSAVRTCLVVNGFSSTYSHPLVNTLTTSYTDARFTTGTTSLGSGVTAQVNYFCVGY